MKRFWMMLSVLALLASAFTWAQSSGGDFEITHHTVDGGGNRSSGGDFTLTGTIGQHEAGPTPASGGNFSVAGGFWARIVLENILFKDSFEDP